MRRRRKRKGGNRVMKKESLQQIEKFYIERGYAGERLRAALAKDKEYNKILAKRKQKLTTQLKVTAAEKRKYVLSIDEDFEILAKCKKLEKRKISGEDRQAVKFIKTQLEHDWRQSLSKALDKLLKKYKILA
jgi:hypothetical protein